MDNVTHSLFALTLARTRWGRVGRGATAALVIASNAPDVDFLATAGRGTASYLQWHRGPTHGLLGIVGLGLVTGVIVWGAGRFPRRLASEPQQRASLPALVGLATLGVLLHVVMDLPTSYGTRLLSPFDWHWFAVDWMPIIDIYLLAILGAGLMFGRGSDRARRHNVAMAFALMAIDYGIHGVAHQQALALAPRLFGPTLPQACEATEARPPIEVWPRALAAAPRDGPPRRCLMELAAIPTFLSPFHWRVVAHLSSAYEIHDVDLLDRRFRTPAPPTEVLWRTTARFPNVWTPAVKAAAAAPSAQIFLGFARFPAARSLVDRSGVATVVWTDLRFTDGPFVGQRRPGGPAPFALTVHVDADNRILQEKIGQ